MGCEIIDVDAAVGKRLKFPKKFFDECKEVDHASVPRKLRSAMKKRSRQSITSPLSASKKRNHMLDGADSLKKDVNESKLNLTRISKDEEEVAETLNALAGMFPGSGSMSESKLNKELSCVKSLASPEVESFVNATYASGQVVKEDEDIRTTNFEFNDEASKQFPDVAVSAGEAAKSGKFEDASACDTFISTEQLKISLQPIVASGYQANQQNMFKEKRNNGSLLWPGLSAVGSSCSDTSPQLRIPKFPNWFGSTDPNAQAQNAKVCLPTLKDSQVPLDLNKSRKRCATHVYISRLIQDLQKVSLAGSQSSSHDRLKQGTHIIQNAVILHKRLLQDQQQASTTSGFNSLVKQQNINFLSLSAGSVMKGSDGTKTLNSQNHPALQFLMPQNGFSAATAQQIVLPSYLGGASARPSIETAMAIARQNTHFTGEYASQMGHAPLLRPSQAQYATSTSSMQALSSKYSPVLWNEQELMSISMSRAASRVRGQYYNFPNSMPPLQLLCNDHR